MELEHMRELLATLAMGWTLSNDYDEFFEHDCDAWFKTAAKNHLMCLAHDWHPDTDWPQCGLIIEAMRAKGWRLNVIMGKSRYYAAFYRLVKSAAGPMREVSAKTFTEAVSRAAARVLEATDA